MTITHPDPQPVRKVRWRPSLGLIVLLSALILVEGVVTVGRMVVRSAKVPPGCTRDLQDRTDQWCRLERTSNLSGTLPTQTQVTEVLGAPKQNWELASGYHDKIINGSVTTIYAACHGNGQLIIRLYAADVQRYSLTVSCKDQFPPEFTVPVQHNSDGSVYPGPYVIGVTPVGEVTAGEYFVR